MDVEILQKKLHTALKLSGFSVRREYCNFIVTKFLESNFDLQSKETLDEIIKGLCTSFEKQCSNEHSIEKDHVERAIESCLSTGYEHNETIFSVINAFDFPKLKYDPDRKLYSIDHRPRTLLSDANSKAALFQERYQTILQRTKRNFSQRLENEKRKIQLQTVDYLLTVTNITLDFTLILGSILQVSEGKYCLEDPTGIVNLDLTYVKYHGGLFVENSFVLVNGYYEDKILHVSTINLPPGEDYESSRPSFGNINYFGGPSKTPLKDSVRLKGHLRDNPDDMILFFSDFWLDHPMIFDKLERLFEGFQNSPPVAFVFMGNFMQESHGVEMMDKLKKLFKQLADLIGKFALIMHNSNFIFVPGLTDPCTPHIVPRLPLPSLLVEEVVKKIPKAHFTTNPCRLQYCTKEIVLFRADIVAKLIQGTLQKPKKSEIADCVTRTIVNQGHLTPMSLNALTVHWGFDYCMRLYPLPDVVVIGDRSEAYQGHHKNCHVVNPGSFCDSFLFKAYTPATDQLDDCEL